MGKKRSELSRQVGIFNKQLQRLQAKNEWWSEVFSKTSTKELREAHKSEADALREIMRLNTLLKGENRQEVPYNPVSPIKVPQGALKQIETLLAKANVQSAKKYKKFPRFAGAQKRSVERERYAPIDKGSGKTKADIKARIRTIKNRADENYNAELERAYLRSFEITVERYMPQYYSQIKNLTSKVKNPFYFYIAAINAKYGGYLQIEYVYPDEEDIAAKAQNVIFALREYLQDEENGSFEEENPLDIFDE